MPSSLPCDAVPLERLALIASSYQRLTGKPLLAGIGDLRQALWQAPCAIVAHGTEADPIFFYGNQLALQLFEIDFAAFIRLPSRLSAEPLQRGARARLLQRVAEQGYIDDYAGVRISASGRRFVISNATVWNLLDADGRYCGQAATFADWRLL